MKKVTLKELKNDLAKWTELAHRGDLVQVTHYNKPYVIITPDLNNHLQVGPTVGKHRLKPAIEKGTDGAFLAYLKEDRSNFR